MTKMGRVDALQVAPPQIRLCPLPERMLAIKSSRCPEEQRLW